MRTAHSLTVYRRILHTPPATMHAPRQPYMPPGNHACPPATTHAPQQPCMPPSNHACPPATTHPPTTRHSPRQPHTTPVDRILDTRFWKYYLDPNFAAGGKNTNDDTKAFSKIHALEKSLGIFPLDGQCGIDVSVYLTVTWILVLCIINVGTLEKSIKVNLLYHFKHPFGQA